MKVRQEDFGGILYNPVADTVYRVNDSGFQLFQELRAAYREGKRDLRRFRSPDFADADVRRFVEYLVEQSIWAPG